MYKDETLYLEMKAQQMALPSMEEQVTCISSEAQFSFSDSPGRSALQARQCGHLDLPEHQLCLPQSCRVGSDTQYSKGHLHHVQARVNREGEDREGQEGEDHSPREHETDEDPLEV